jgi:RNA polymerase sigma-70 factor (ECF subfamily)
MPTASDREGRFEALVERYMDFVARALRNAGTPQADVDDDVQRTLIAAARRLDDVRHGAEKLFLLRIAQHTAAHARRTLARRREIPQDDAPEMGDVSACPERLTEQRRAQRRLLDVLERMEVRLRNVFVLYEFEGMNMAEIAELLALPRGTVASRLRRARADFRARMCGLPDAEEAVPAARPRRARRSRDPSAPT